MIKKHQSISTIGIADALIDVYKVNFVSNLIYVLRFTGMSLTRYKRECRKIGLPRPYIISQITKGEHVGFNLIHVATMATIFRIPVTVILNMNMKSEQIDLTKYKLRENMYRSRKIDDEYYIRMTMGSIEAARKHGYGHLVSDIKKRSRKMKELFNPFEL